MFCTLLRAYSYFKQTGGADWIPHVWAEQGWLGFDSWYNTLGEKGSI